VTSGTKKGKEVNPFLSYEVARGIVEETVISSERRARWRRRVKEVEPALPSWDAGVVQLLASESEGEQEMVDA
jgi:hypothetical protein